MLTLQLLKGQVDQTVKNFMPNATRLWLRKLDSAYLFCQKEVVDKYLLLLISTGEYGGVGKETMVYTPDSFSSEG